MKKIYSLLIILLSFLFSAAQPTIYQSDLPVAGTGWRTAHDSAYVASIPAGGANVTWDYTGLQNLEADTAGFAAASASPYASLFPSSNLTSYNWKDTSWSFYQTNSSGLYVDGAFSVSTGTRFKYDTSEVYVPVPFTYNDTRNDFAVLVFDSVAAGNCARFIHRVNSTIVADGWGTLQLPTGNYSNVLRLNITRLTIDTVLLDIGCTGTYTYYAFFPATVTQVTQYMYLRSGASYPYLLGIDADSLGTTSTSSDYFLNGYNGVGVNELSSVNNILSAYPNPAKDMIHFNISGNNPVNMHSVIKIYDATGREVYSSNTEGLSSLDVPVANLESGIYYYSLISDHSTDSGKFTIVH